ncbi:hypothetical protein DMT42_32275 [Streptomyces actuosus]|uniref:Uncharacterized protein n=1 Tax=Streptomyces actuosus TaxID=1885 RepID=A0A2U9P9Q6_STRAS|nr:hypothetical protein DMT42_32275 [Streptomyces actuosus]
MRHQTFGEARAGAADEGLLAGHELVSVSAGWFCGPSPDPVGPSPDPVGPSPDPVGPSPDPVGP